GVTHQVLADAIHIFGDSGITNQLGSGFHFLGVLLAHADLALQRVPVAESAAAYLAIAGGVNVALAAIVLHLAVVRLLDDWLQAFFVLRGVFIVFIILGTSLGFITVFCVDIGRGFVFVLLNRGGFIFIVRRGRGKMGAGGWVRRLVRKSARGKPK